MTLGEGQGQFIEKGEVWAGPRGLRGIGQAYVQGRGCSRQREGMCEGQRWGMVVGGGVGRWLKVGVGLSKEVMEDESDCQAGSMPWRPTFNSSDLFLRFSDRSLLKISEPVSASVRCLAGRLQGIGLQLAPCTCFEPPKRKGWLHMFSVSPALVCLTSTWCELIEDGPVHTERSRCPELLSCMLVVICNFLSTRCLRVSQ